MAELFASFIFVPAKICLIKCLKVRLTRPENAFGSGVVPACAHLQSDPNCPRCSAHALQFPVPDFHLQGEQIGDKKKQVTKQGDGNNIASGGVRPMYL